MRFVLAVILLWAFPVLGHDYRRGGIQILHPYTHPALGPTAVGYMTLSNDGPADRLVGVSIAGARATLHQTVIENDVARMRPLTDVVLRPGASVAFAPGGLHVMFVGLQDRWVAGDKVPAVLMFETAGAVPVIFNVDPRPTGGAAVDHSTMDMGN